MLTPIRVFGHNQFTRHNQTKTLSAEASSLGLRPGQTPLYRLYDDAADFGMFLSTRAGEPTAWYLNEEIKNEGDLMAWEFRPCVETIRKYPALKTWAVIVFND